MAKRTGSPNPRKQELIGELKKQASVAKQPLWKRVAFDLEMSSRANKVVNISRINRVTKEGETIIVPGKVLGTGQLDHKLTIAAYSFSKSAMLSIQESKATAVLIRDFVKNDIKGKKVRLIG